MKMRNCLYASIFLITIIIPFISKAQASFLLDDKQNNNGFYTYDVPPQAPNNPFKGDIGREFVSFNDGALMDRCQEDGGESVGFTSSSTARTQRRTIIFDLGQEVDICSVSIKSKLKAGWGLCEWFAEFSKDGEFGQNTMIGSDGIDQVPHEEGLQQEISLSLHNVQARYMRLMLMFPLGRNIQIDEVHIVANTIPGKQSVIHDTNDLRRIIDHQIHSPLVDEFGQWTRDEWPGKIHTEKELKRRLAAEEKRYKRVRLDRFRYDEFGGDLTLGIKENATGKWRLEKIGDRWWFITPSGNPFLMIAVDAVYIRDCWHMNTIEHPDLPDQKDKFTWVPAREGKLVECVWFENLGYGADFGKMPSAGRFAECWWTPDEKIWRFNYFQANLIKAFGKNFADRFYTLARGRLWDWGFNSAGKWTWRGEVDHLKIPFIIVVYPKQSPALRLPYVDDVYDPWAPGFQTAVEHAVKLHAEHYKNNPYFIGVSLGNEGWWDDTTTQKFLDANSALPFAKVEFVKGLQGAYGSIEALNQQCGAQWASFDSMAGSDLNPFAGAMSQDIKKFISLASEKFYSSWRCAIDTYAPDRLILGSSFVPGAFAPTSTWWHACREWIDPSIPYSDALMFDYYTLDPDLVVKNCIEPLAIPADKPVLIGEYGFTTTQRGFLEWDCCGVPNQKSRGLAYAKYNEKLFAHPNFVGSMFFLYADEVPLGRDFDGGGESFNFGLVDICNLPYYDFVNEIKQTNPGLYSIHAQ